MKKNTVILIVITTLMLFGIFNQVDTYPQTSPYQGEEAEKNQDTLILQRALKMCNRHFSNNNRRILKNSFDRALYDLCQMLTEDFL
uniref:Secreted protein n=1 Tax=Parastrongyloides trichosuri TaxID=131310 RepID=A0A0N4Z502_PARTI